MRVTSGTYWQLVPRRCPPRSKHWVLLSPARGAGGCKDKVGSEEGSHMDTLSPPQHLTCLPGSRGCTCWVARGEGSNVSFPAEL